VCGSEAALYLVLPVLRLLPCLRAQAVRAPRGVHVEETPLVGLLGRAGRDVGRLGDVGDGGEVDGRPDELVLPGVVVEELVLDGVQLEPALLPGLEERAALVEVALVEHVGVPALLPALWVAEAVLLAAPSPGPAAHLALLRYIPPGAGLGHELPALLVAVEPAVLAPVSGPDDAPEDGGAEVAGHRGRVVVPLEPVRMGVGPASTSLTLASSSRAHLAPAGGQQGARCKQGVQGASKESNVQARSTR